jgi:hypothetical protein
MGSTKIKKSEAAHCRKELNEASLELAEMNSIRQRCGRAKYLSFTFLEKL